MSFTRRPQAIWQLRTRTITLGRKTLVIGIVNVTPDSFSEGAAGNPATASHEAAIEHGLRLLNEGADGLDIGGESTRPGSHAATADALTTLAEQDRVLPVIGGILQERPGTLLSIDTYHADTARAAVAAGCEIVNDVSGLLWDADRETGMAASCAQMACGLVLVHTRGRPHEWRRLPRLATGEVVPLVERELGERLAAAMAAGILAERIVLDPGYGFGKAFGANYALLSGQAGLLGLGRPLLAGVSRKSFLGRSLAPLHGGVDAPPSQREAGSIAALVAAVLGGASLVRVHEVRAAAEAAAVADAILAAAEVEAPQD